MIDFFKLSPRLSRIQYLGFLSFWVAFTALGAFTKQIFVEPSMLIKLLGSLIGVIGVINILFVKIRRLHDMNFSAWWILLNFIPLIGQIWMFIVFIMPGSYGMNRFGTPPVANTGFNYLLILTAPITFMVLRQYGIHV